MAVKESEGATTVTLDDETIEALAEAIVRRLVERYELRPRQTMMSAPPAQRGHHPT